MKKYFNKFIIILLSFYAFWILGIPYLFSRVLPLVCENISLNSNYIIEVEKPGIILSPIPKASIHAQSITVKDKKSNDYTQIENFHAAVRILPIFTGRFHINKIKAENIIIESTLNNNPELDKNFINNLSKTKFKFDELNVSSLSVKIWQNNIKTPVIYNAKNVYFKRNLRALKLNLESKLEVSGVESKADIALYLPQDNDVRKSIIDVSFDNFDIAPLGDYLRQYLPKDLSNIKGIIDIRIDKQNLNMVLKNFAIIMKDDAKSIVFPDNLKINSNFRITNRIINLINLDIKSNNISATINGNILNYLDKSKTALNLDVILNKSKAEDIIKMLPPIIVEEFNVYKLKYYKFYGNAIGNFTIKGDIYEPEIFGDIFIKDSVLIKPIKNAPGATIKLKFTGKYLQYDVNVPAGMAERVWVKGGVELYNVKYADMHIWSTQNVDLKVAEEKVVPLHEILNFIIGPVPIMDINGSGNIDITVKGNRKNPHVWGQLNVDNLKTFFKDIPDLILENAKATLYFNDQNAEFKTAKGFVDNKPISVLGTCNLYGKFDFDVKSSSQELNYLYNAVQTSAMLNEIKQMLPKLDSCKGLSDISLKVYGSVLDIKDICFNKNLFVKGNIKLNNNAFTAQGITIDKANGNIKFDTNNADANISGNIGNSPIDIKALVKNNSANVSVSIPKLNIGDLLNLDKDIKSDFGNILLNISAKYKGKIDEIEYNKINLIAKVLGVEDNNRLKLSNGTFEVNNGKLKISNLNGNIDNNSSSFNINIDTENVFYSPRINGNVQLKNFDLTSWNYINKYSFVPENLRTLDFKKGKINLNCKVHNNKANGYTDLGGIELLYKPMDMPVKIVNGSLLIRNNSLKFNKINLLADNMPILADGTINDIFKKQNFDIYINSKPKQEFIDNYINKNQIYPVKIKGDIDYTLRLKGVKDNFDVKADANIPKDSSVYYLGATVGDNENAIVLNLDTKITHQNILKIKEFSYDKVISSLGSRQTQLNMLKARGGIEVFNDDLVFHDLYIKTQNPTDARIFNIIFRKPNIKQGQFTSDLKFNGKLSDPILSGDFHIFETNIPFLDTTMKNISFKFKDKYIELFSKGEILGNDIKIKALLKNKLTTPYYVEKAELYTSVLDLNNLIQKLKLSQVDSYGTFEHLEGLDLASIIIKDINLNADNIYLRNIVATNFEANAWVNEKKIANVNNFKFNIANGNLNGKFSYNYTNNNTNLELNAKNISANDLTYALFDLNNQIYGDLTGDIKLTCSGENFENCMKTLNGKTTFNVTDGKMPKLGSLEYLLKAGNLVKGGITGISINSVIDIITPLKTGNFSGIYGTIGIKDGIADNIEITTKGKDLSLFVTGKYNFSNANADMEVFGMLSKKISTMFGPLGNLSLNTLFNAIPGVDLTKNTKLIEKINKVPGIELNSKLYRKFIAEIKGNINGDDYVTSFKWIN